MVIKTTQRTVGRVAAILGMIQGLIYAALSLTCIVLYNKSHNVDLPKESYNEYLQYLLFHQYLSSDPLFEIQAVIRPFDFTIFMWVYYFFSIGWLVASLDLFAAIHYNKRRQSLLMVIWGAITAAISIVDLIFTCLLVRDYTACSEDPSKLECYLTVGIVMTIAARGYTLWIVNAVFAFIIVSTAQKIIKQDNLTGVYDHYKIPRAKVPHSDSTLERPNNHWNENIYCATNSPETRQTPAFIAKPNENFY